MLPQSHQGRHYEFKLMQIQCTPTHSGWTGREHRLPGSNAYKASYIMSLKVSGEDFSSHFKSLSHIKSEEVA